MTAKRDLKKRIRQRASRTGERYSAARQHILGGRDGGGGSRGKVPFIELRDLSDEAATLGFRCPVHAFPELARRVDCPALLVQIRDALRGTEGDFRTELLRSVILRGELPDLPYPLADDLLRDALLRDARQYIRMLASHSDPTAAPRAIAIPAIESEAFIARARAGIGGISESGRLLALQTAGSGGQEMVICQLWYSPVPQRTARTHALILLRPDDFFISVDEATPGAPAR
jgi:hypothetical protein